jgi:hypothetical protein
MHAQVFVAGENVKHLVCYVADGDPVGSYEAALS